MKMLSRIAILINLESKLTFELEDLAIAFKKTGVDVKIFTDIENILSYQPDCVINTSIQDPKLTPYPTYGLIDKPRDEYLETPRFLRNLLTYDGYLISSPRLEQTVGDLLFGARKLGSTFVKFSLLPSATEFKVPLISKNPSVVIFEPHFQKSKFKNTISYLLDHIENAYVVTYSPPMLHKHVKRFIKVKDSANLGELLNKHAIAVCLESGDQQEKILYPAIIKLIAASTITIAHRTPELESYFDDTIFYIPPDIYPDVLANVIKKHVRQIKAHPEEAIDKSRKAHQLVQEHFTLDRLLPSFLDFHQTTLINKGYVPNPDPAFEKALPSASYIIRTGGKHRPFLERTLDCLVAQQYPDLRAILVIHDEFPYIDELIAKYPSLKIKVVKSIKSRRSEAICDGMAAVETELFGLFDDDDEIFPNHVRSLVKTLQYHTNRDWRGEIGMVYSGSIHADDINLVLERPEFRDPKLLQKQEKRAIEHFKFYSSVLMSEHAWFMPNGWLARTQLIDDELLTDPVLDTCEDLYFELQIAQRKHLAFSVEVTAIHHFHHLGNSTIDDSHKHVPDTQRIALRNFSRVFPPDKLYDTYPNFYYNLVGQKSTHDPNQIFYQDSLIHATAGEHYFHNPFFPFRAKYAPVTYNTAQATMSAKNYTYIVVSLILYIITIPCHLLLYAIKYTQLSKEKKKDYLNKFKKSCMEKGYIATLYQVIIKKSNPFAESMNPPHSLTYYKIKIMFKYLGLKKFIRLGLKKLTQSAKKRGNAKVR